MTGNRNGKVESTLALHLVAKAGAASGPDAQEVVVKVILSSDQAHRYDPVVI